MIGVCLHMFAKLVFWECLGPMERDSKFKLHCIEMQDAECWSRTERGQGLGLYSEGSLASEIIAAIWLHLEIWHWWLVISRAVIDFLAEEPALAIVCWNSIDITSSRKSLLMGFFCRTPMVTWLLLLSWAEKRRCSQFVGNWIAWKMHVWKGKTLQFPGS